MPVRRRAAALPQLGDTPAASVVMTVLNEERHLRTAVRAVLEQDYAGEIELVLALGPSVDATDSVAAALAAADPRVRCVRNPTGHTPVGLNAAIRASRHPVVVRVDGHAVLPPDYVRLAVDALRRTGAVNVGGVMAAEGETAFERAVAAAMTSPFGVGNAAFHTGGREGPADTVYLGVFRREALERVGLYDETFRRAQDWEMNHRLRSAGGQVWFEPRMRVSYRPRGSVRALGRQYLEYGRWRRVVMRQHPETRYSTRYLAPPALVLALVLGSAAGVAGWRPGLLVPAGYGVGVLAVTPSVARGQPLEVAAWVPTVLVTMHVCWGVGFLTSRRRLARTPSAPGGSAR